MMYNLYRGTADKNWFGVVVLNLGLPVYTEFPCLKIFPLHNFQKWDCLRILVHTFGIGLLLLMISSLDHEVKAGPNCLRPDTH